MSMQSEGKDAKGRNFHQSTRDGTGSAASVGTGGTGDIGAMGSERSESTRQGSQQSASRTDDLLAGDTTRQEADRGFSGAGQGGRVETGMEGIGQRGKAGSQQSDPQGRGSRQGADSRATDGDKDDQRDQGSAPRER